MTNDSDLDRLDVDEVGRFFARRWKVIAGVALASLVLATVVCVSLTPVYTATSQVLLDPRKQHIFGADGVPSDAGLDSSIVDSQIPIILSSPVLAKVVAKENLADDPEFAAPTQPGLLDRLFGLFKARKATTLEGPSLDGIDPRIAPIITRLFAKIDVTRVAKSYVLSLAVSSRDPGKAMRLANTLAQTYVEDQIAVHAKSVQQAAAFFEDRLGSLRDQVRQSEQAVADFRKTHDLTPTTMDGPITVGEQQLQDLNEKLATSSADTAEKLARYQQAMRFKANGSSLDTLPEIIRSPVITQLRTQQADLTRREADLAAMYGPAYPAITQIHAQKSGLDRAITAEMTRLATTLRNDYEVARSREASMRKTIDGMTDSAGGDNDVGVKLRELQRTNLANKALFENFLNRAKLTQEQSNFEEPDARLISPALEPPTPSFPKTKLIVAVAGVAGLLLGLGIAAGLDLVFGRTMAGSPDVPLARASAFILGHVPDVPAGFGAETDRVAYFDEHPRSDFARGIDDLAAKLAPPHRPGDAADGRIVALSALGTREESSSLSLCIAAAVGRDRRVLVIDGDPARRGLSRRFELANHPGLSDVLVGDLSANKAVVRRERYAVLPAGRKPLDAAATAKPLGLFLQEARQRFDLVIIDAPAFDGAGDGVGIASRADGIALVACWDELLREDFITAVDAVADQPNFAGIILDRADARDVEDLALAS